MGRDRKFIVLRKDFMGLCRNREILCREIVGMAGTIFVTTKDF